MNKTFFTVRRSLYLFLSHALLYTQSKLADILPVLAWILNYYYFFLELLKDKIFREQQPTLYLVNTSFENPYLHWLDTHKITDIVWELFCYFFYNFWQYIWLLPQVDNMVLMVSSVEVDFTWVDEQECKQDDEDLNGIPPSIYKISIKHIWLLQGRHSILQTTFVKHSLFLTGMFTGHYWSVRSSFLGLLFLSFAWDFMLKHVKLREWVSDLVENQQQIFQLPV